ncbi:hypothetical protein [Actinomadura roseirufa]|uniref:hypothetical protein n=1 Tax=Actinomadura roseirufa TaxID=2094049 RepID=UPI001041289B|nr:hypothetical protein [Actinomadura roseirufa]
MTDPLAPGPHPATPADLRAAQERARLLREELPRVREAAAAWRNGLGGVLAALVGFSAIKGRSDLTQLAPGWALTAGGLLFGALVAGVCGALLLLRAAHGRPAATAARPLPPRVVADHIEAIASAKALRRGIASTLTCAVLLMSALATTWYGPSRTSPALRVTTTSGLVCGTAARTDGARLVLRVSGTEVAVAYADITDLRPVPACP